MPLIRKDASKTPATDLPSMVPADLRAPSNEIRWSAARQLAQNPLNSRVLGEALATENDPRVREALFTGLAHIQTPEAVAFILPHIRSQDASVRAGAIDALSIIPQAVETQLPALLADSDPDVRLLACEIVRRLSAPIATKLLCDLLIREPLANVCGAAVEALSEVGDESALNALESCAARFPSEPFLLFSVKAVITRIAGNSGSRSSTTP